MADDSLSRVDDLLTVAMPIVERVVRQRFRVSLSRDDARGENERARECVQDALLQLVGKFRRVANGVDAAIDNVADYAARVAHNTVNDEIRSSVPDRAQLKNRLRHVLREDPAFDTWPDRDGMPLAGYAGWRQRQPRAAITAVTRAADLQRDPLLATHWRNLGRAQWVALLTRLFDLAGGPLDLDDLHGCLSDLLGVSSRRPESLDDDPDGGDDRDARLVDEALSPEGVAAQRENLVRLWSCLRGLRREWLFAFLLNPPGLGDGRRRDTGANPHRGTLRGEIDVLPANGVTTVAEIGDLLALTPEQLRHLSSELGGVSPIEERPLLFHEVWRHLPLTDRVIGDLLGKTGGQVIGLRVQAIRQLAGCLGPRVRATEAGHTRAPHSSGSGKAS